ncbi:AAA family ATPase [Streptomyces sp. CA-294286]|uniref:helix-turn-helix transcriptional regulator n=1 Tax=Streptomyces sp. CA-294286 TaxID=3240070 RepID=UPI003D914ACA
MISSTTVRHPLRLYGRSGELAVLDGLLGRLRDGHGGALVVSAPPGQGRTALLGRALADHAELPGGAALHVTAAPSERRLPHSGLHALLCAAPRPLPVPADRVLRSGVPPGALLEFLRALGSERPLLVCVDDAHHWDRDSRAALGFAARRLGAGSPVAVLLSTVDETDFGGLPVVRPGPLDDGAASALLDRLTEAAHGVDPVVRGELLRAAAGNPLLLAGLTARLSPGQLAGRTALPHPLPGGEGVLRAHAALLDGLSPHVWTLLLLAAAAAAHEPDGAGADVALVLGAAARAGLGPALPERVLLDPGASAGALQLAGDRVHFRHPLLRRAVLHRASPARRRAVHELLAALLPGPGTASLPRLVQLACAASGHDAALAGQLAAGAVAPRPHAERSAALARAAGLTADDTLRAARFAEAAEQSRLAGDAGRARALLARPGPRAGQGGALCVRGLLLLRDGPAADAREALLGAAALLAPYDPRRAQEALLGAAEAAWASGDVPAYLEALRRIPASADDPAVLRYRSGMCAVLTGRTAEGHALLRRNLAAAEDAGDPAELLRAVVSALVLGEIDTACRTGARTLAAVRAAGPDVLLPKVLEHLAHAELRAGRHARARAHAQEGLQAARRTGQPNTATHLHAVLALVASVEGDGAACAAHFDAALEGAGPHGLQQAATLATWAVARAELARGRPAEAAARLAPLVLPGPRRGHFATRMLAVPCYVEATVVAGRAGAGPDGVPNAAADGAAAAVAEFALWTGRTADPQAPALLARCRALLASPEEAAARYEEALVHHDRAGGDFERARTQLLYGQWLRRRRRTREARGPLRDALVGFERCSARSWAERAAGELRAAGEAVDARPAAERSTLAGLTPQQHRIARYVAEGATNREVAVRLSLSPRTVDHHLRNVFAALGVRSRTELARLLGS